MRRNSKPLLLQFILARSFSISAIGTGAAFLAAFILQTYSGWSQFADFGDVILYAGGALAMGTLGCLAGCIGVWPLLSAGASELNGAPFLNGDCVEILVGPCRGLLVQVYEVWGARNQVRVDLGVQRKKDVTDVFHFCEVFRVGGE